MTTNTNPPNSTEELWRYSRIDEFSYSDFQPATPSEVVALPDAVGAVLDALGCTYENAIFSVNGFLNDPETLPSGVSLSRRDGSPAPLSEGAAYFCSAFGEAMGSAVEVSIASNTVLEQPLVFVHVVSGTKTANFVNVSINAGENTKATIVEVIASDDEQNVVVPQMKMNLAAGANVDYCNLQLLHSTSWQFGFQTTLVERDATLRSTSIALGGYYARVETESHLVGIGGQAYLNALYFGTDEQMHDFRTLQGHTAAKTTSDLLFKGAVANTAQSVYSGLIRVERGAAGTRAFQTNRNLVLSDGAHADSVPNLEIDEQDVACSHASAVGPVDEDQLYYLESRGVPTDVARRLIVLGFLGELVDNTGLSGLANYIDTLLSEKLDAAHVSSIDVAGDAAGDEAGAAK